MVGGYNHIILAQLCHVADRKTEFHRVRVQNHSILREMLNKRLFRKRQLRWGIMLKSCPVRRG